MHIRLAPIYKSNKFNQLDEMQNHMSNLITKKNGEDTDDYVESEKNSKNDSKKRKKNHQI
jgi:hypothetical protein